MRGLKEAATALEYYKHFIVFIFLVRSNENFKISHVRAEEGEENYEWNKI